jgi:hypothetical protein
MSKLLYFRDEQALILPDSLILSAYRRKQNPFQFYLQIWDFAIERALGAERS